MGGIATFQLIAVPVDMSLYECSSCMMTEAIRRVVVVQDGEPVGIVSDTDLFRTVDEFGWVAEQGLSWALREGLVVLKRGSSTVVLTQGCDIVSIRTLSEWPVWLLPCRASGGEVPAGLNPRGAGSTPDLLSCRPERASDLPDRAADRGGDVLRSTASCDQISVVRCKGQVK
ncbi:MAG: hypothetical protein ACI9EF_000442 [Pseudohongiellaceae bacterium]